MRNIKSLRNIYGLKEDTSGFKSSLVTWYNEVIKKTYADLDARDVSKMMRQNILREIAIDKAIEILQEDPFIWELYDGDVLITTINFLNIIDINRNNNRKKLTSIIEISEESASKFEWTSDKAKKDFNKSIAKLKELLSKTQGNDSSETQV